jgi:hypothetical protein
MRESDRELLRRGVLLGLWVSVGIWLGRATLLPAPVRNARLSGLSGAKPLYAMLVWTFGGGLRPASIIFDIEVAGGASGSVTTDGEALEAEVPLIGAGEAGPYTLTASATYRILGFPRTIIYRFAG